MVHFCEEIKGNHLNLKLWMTIRRSPQFGNPCCGACLYQCSEEVLTDRTGWEVPTWSLDQFRVITAEPPRCVSATSRPWAHHLWPRCDSCQRGSGDGRGRVVALLPPAGTVQLMQTNKTHTRTHTPFATLLPFKDTQLLSQRVVGWPWDDQMSLSA